MSYDDKVWIQGLAVCVIYLFIWLIWGGSVLTVWGTVGLLLLTNLVSTIRIILYASQKRRKG